MAKNKVLDKLKNLYLKNPRKLTEMLVGDWSSILSKEILDSIMMTVIKLREHYHRWDNAVITPTIVNTFEFLKKVKPHTCNGIVVCKGSELYEYMDSKHWNNIGIIVFPKILSSCNLPPTSHKKIWEEVREGLITELSKELEVNWFLVDAETEDKHIHFTRNVKRYHKVNQELILELNKSFK